MAIPHLRQLFNWSTMPLDLIILREDKRAVTTRRPRKIDLRVGEKLIRGDGPIRAFRRRRDELIEAARE